MCMLSTRVKLERGQDKSLLILLLILIHKSDRNGFEKLINFKTAKGPKLNISNMALSNSRYCYIHLHVSRYK